VAPITSAQAPAPTLPPPPSAAPTAPQAPVAAAAAAGAAGAGAMTAMQPGAVAPQAPKRPQKVIEKTKPSRRLEPGDLVCGECGEGNSPARKFCSRCGSSLAQAEVVKKKWWQKFVPKRRRKVLEAGQRPGREGVKKKRKLSFQPIMRYGRLAIGGALLLGGILWATHPPSRSFINDKLERGRDIVTDPFVREFTPIRPTQIGANPAQPDPDNPGQDLAGRVIDTLTNTTYTFNPPDPATNTLQSITVQFDRRVNVDRLIVFNGSPEGFSDFHRPERLHLVFSSDETTDITLEDTPDQQQVTIEDNAGRDVTSVEIQFLSVYRSTTEGALAAISEIEFFQGE
jgi:hypothetical protein